MFSSKRSHEVQSLAPDDSDVSALIIETIDHLKLDPRETILLGSAALSLYGVTLDEHDAVSTPDSRRPSDLDFASTASYMNQLYTGGTPSGLRAELKTSHAPKYTILHIDTPAMPVDITTTYQAGSPGMLKHDNKLRQRIERYAVPIDGTDMRVAAPNDLAKILKYNSSDPKARQDLAALRRRFPSL